MMDAHTMPQMGTIMPTLIKRPHAFGWIVQVVSDQRKGVEAFYSLPEQESQAIESVWNAWRLHG